MANARSIRVAQATNAPAVGNAGITKRSKTANKKTKAKPKAIAKKTRGVRESGPAQTISANEREEENENGDVEEDENPDTIALDENDDGDDETNNDPLQGVTNPLERMQIKALIAEEERKRAEEERKRELHALEIRQREAQLAVMPSLTASKLADNDFGESSLSPPAQQALLFFPHVPKKYKIAIAKNTFDPGNLPYLNRLLVDDTASDINITVEDGHLKQSKAVGKASAFGKDYTIWSTNFLTYTGLVALFHAGNHPTLVGKLLEFHNVIVELAPAYDWQKAVLILALHHHRAALHKGFADLDAWDVQGSLIERICRGHVKPFNSPASGKPAGNLSSKGLNTAGVACINWNTKGCTYDKCKREHKCSTCGGSHPATKCTKKFKEETQ